eukprot:357218-Chlamydomonas_euryale.AAC.33
MEGSGRMQACVRCSGRRSEIRQVAGDIMEKDAQSKYHGMHAFASASGKRVCAQVRRPTPAAATTTGACPPPGPQPVHSQSPQPYDSLTTARTSAAVQQHDNRKTPRSLSISAHHSPCAEPPSTRPRCTGDRHSHTLTLSHSLTLTLTLSHSHTLTCSR